MSLMSSDQVIFYVHRLHLSSISSNAFAGLLPTLATSFFVTERATVLDIVLHIVYGRPYTDMNPPLSEIEAALDALIKYGVNPYAHAIPHQRGSLRKEIHVFMRFRNSSAYRESELSSLKSLACKIISPWPLAIVVSISLRVRSPNSPTFWLS